MWRRVLTWLRGSDPTPEKQPESLRKTITRLEIQLGELHDLIYALQDRHEKLASRKYGALGGRPPGRPAEPAEPLTKAQLRMRLGIVPGQPYRHQSGADHAD